MKIWSVRMPHLKQLPLHVMLAASAIAQESAQSVDPTSQQTAQARIDEAARLRASLIDELPPEIVSRIRMWQAELDSAPCLHVVCDDTWTWSKITQTTEGSPSLEQYARERFEYRVWMTPTSSWLVAYPYLQDANGAEHLNTEESHLELLWKDGTIWERVWTPSEQAYLVDRYASPTPMGQIDVSGKWYSKGCGVGVVLGSWLAADRQLADTIALRREVAMEPGRACTLEECRLVPFRPVTFDSDQSGSLDYARVDWVWLSASNRVERWRTTAVNRMGDFPALIEAERRFLYKFVETLPEDVSRKADEFATEVDAAIADGKP